MSICARIIVSVSLHEVDNAPNAKTCPDGYDEGLKNAYRTVEKCHNVEFAGILRDHGLRISHVGQNALSPNCNSRNSVLQRLHSV